MPTKHMIPLASHRKNLVKPVNKTSPSLIDEIFKVTFPWSILESLTDEDQGDSSKQYFTPKLDVLSDNKEYLIKVELPGVPIDAINLDLKNKTLIIKGTKAKIIDAEAKNQDHLQERTFGQFYRELELPDDANCAEIEAAQKNGVLTIRIPKKCEDLPKTITINKV